MSRETSEWLNEFVLVGMVEKYGTAWHKTDIKGLEPNHYDGPIPFADLERRLFFWEPVEAKLQIILPDGTQITDKDRKAIVRPDTKSIFGIFKNGYQIHGYSEWLYSEVEKLFDTKLLCSSSGLLQGGALGWVQLETPESVTTPEGVEYRPHILCSTSLNGTVATTYAMTKTVTVCDNTYEYAMSQVGNRKVRLKHTRYSRLKVQDTMDALQLVYESNDDFNAEIAELCNTTVTDAQWEKFLEEINPIPEEEGRGKTVAQNKRDRLTGMYESDDRVKPWAGTAFGVVQCVSTYSQWENGVHNEENNPDARMERNMLHVIKGTVGKNDSEVLQTLEAVLAQIYTLSQFHRWLRIVIKTKRETDYE